MFKLLYEVFDRWKCYLSESKLSWLGGVRLTPDARIVSCFKISFTIIRELVYFSATIFELFQNLKLVQSLSPTMAQVMVKSSKAVSWKCCILKVSISRVSFHAVGQAVHFKLIFNFILFNNKNKLVIYIIHFNYVIIIKNPSIILLNNSIIFINN